MKKAIPLVITAVFLALAVVMLLPIAPTSVAQQVENRVGAQFSTWWIYDSPEDISINGEVTGRNDWHANLGVRGGDSPVLESKEIENHERVFSKTAVRLLTHHLGYGIAAGMYTL